MAENIPLDLGSKPGSPPNTTGPPGHANGNSHARSVASDSGKLSARSGGANAAGSGAAGIGAIVEADDKGIIFITSVFPGGPADRTGKLRPADIILEIDGIPAGRPGPGESPESGPSSSMVERRIRRIVAQLLGPEGSTVKLKIFRVRPQGHEMVDVEVVRGGLSKRTGPVTQSAPPPLAFAPAGAGILGFGGGGGGNAPDLVPAAGPADLPGYGAPESDRRGEWGWDTSDHTKGQGKEKGVFEQALQLLMGPLSMCEPWQVRSGHEPRGAPVYGSD